MDREEQGMLDILGPIGAVSGNDSTLEFGNVGVTNCVYLAIKGLPDSVPTVVYSPDELDDLLEIVEVGVLESKRPRPGTIQRLGFLKAKPITLRIALIHPHNGPPRLLLRFLQGSWSHDFTVPPADLYQLLKVGKVEGPPPLSGPLTRLKDGGWQVAGETLVLAEGLSSGCGFYGEYLHPDEVSEGEEVEVWDLPLEGEKLVVAFRLKKRWTPPGRIDEPTGKEGDALLARGQTFRALHRYREMGAAQLESRKVSAPWAAKAALSSLLCHLGNGDDKAAQAIWLGQTDDPFLSIGLKALEAGQADAHDSALFQQVSAYFHSLNPDVASAENAVNRIMSALYEHYGKDESVLRRVTLSNWYLHLREVHEGQPSEAALQAWSRARASFPEQVVSKTLRFPLPGAWVMEEALVSISPSPVPRSARVSLLSTDRLKRGLVVALILLLAVFVAKFVGGPHRPTGPPRITVKEDMLELDGKPVFAEPPDVEDVKRVLGVPSRDLSPKPNFYYVFYNGSQRAILEVMDLSWMGSSRSVGFVLEASETKFGEYEPINLIKRIESAD